MKWTEDQQKAIEARKGTLLVSAAAGSGKTAVLVERVIQRLCDSEDPCGVEQLLIVTFTNAAAAQMKEKISAAIGVRIALDPSNKRLRRQQGVKLRGGLRTDNIDRRGFCRFLPWNRNGVKADMGGAGLGL